MREFISIIEAEQLDEAGAGASRIVTHIREGDPFFMISASRATLSPAENKKRTQLLKKTLANLPGVSFIEADGFYQEEGSEPSNEESFFVLPRSDNTNMKKFHIVGRKLMKLFDQESILTGNGEEVALEYANGENFSLGSVTTFSLDAINRLPGHSIVHNVPFGFTTPDVAPAGVKYGSNSKVA